ncbi:MAG: glutamyl-tRNA(Gln) and/or aspartyl-tRNA(Asn) amidotransferase subunit [Parcubacteria group bacterium]|nr:glutamyl-tRNA(Gln) and/or aspartyl-tRNA(Asn) amidotransferase subunit [Parcubacteria group bacterium]
MNKDEVLRLSKLARIEVGNVEAEKLSHEFDAILGYVAEVKNAVAARSADAEEVPGDFMLRNVLREDSEPHESGLYTEQILKNAPASENGYMKVKKIL